MKSEEERKARQAEHRARCDAAKREQGLVRVSIWVPAHRKQDYIKMSTQECEMFLRNC